MTFNEKQVIAAIMAAKDNASIAEAEFVRAIIIDKRAQHYVDWYKENRAQLSNTPATVKAAELWKEATTFKDNVLGFLAIIAGERFSEAQNVPGQRFMGGMNIANAIGYEYDSLEWRCAMAGAMNHINGIGGIIVDREGNLLS